MKRNDLEKVRKEAEIRETRRGEMQWKREENLRTELGGGEVDKKYYRIKKNERNRRGEKIQPGSSLYLF
jgi:hypothetical protein